MSIDLCSNILAISPDLPLKCFQICTAYSDTTNLQTYKFTDLLSRWCSHWMAVVLGLHLTVLHCEVSLL